MKLTDYPDYSDHGSQQAGNFQNLSTTMSFFNGSLRISALFDRKGDVAKSNSSDSFAVSFGRDRAATWHYAFRQYRMTPAQQAGMEKSLTSGGSYRGFVFHEDGSFIRFRELTLAYDAPQAFSRAFGASRASITLGARNLLLWTPYTGLDPETITRGGITNFPANEEFFGEAQPRTFFTRVSLTF